MKIVVTGGAGFLGRKLTEALLAVDSLRRSDGTPDPVREVIVFDAAEPTPFPSNDPRLKVLIGNIADADIVQRLVEPGTDSVFHLAAVVSGAAEADFDLGMRVNVDGTRALLQACRALATPPKLVFASSVAVFGGDLPDVLDDATSLNPQTSYGVQKAIGELLVGDYSRKGFIDGRSLRLPTIVVRPGKPNKAASSFASSILREPLSGQEVVCPVGPEARMWILSPRQVIAAFLHAHELPPSAWEGNCSLNLPGISVRVSAMVEALRRVGGEAAAARVRWEPDPFIQRIVAGWPGAFGTPRAEQLGFQADASIDEMIRAFIEDELQSKQAA